MLTPNLAWGIKERLHRESILGLKWLALWQRNKKGPSKPWEQYVKDVEKHSIFSKCFGVTGTECVHGGGAWGGRWLGLERWVGPDYAGSYMTCLGVWTLTCRLMGANAEY